MRVIHIVQIIRTGRILTISTGRGRADFPGVVIHGKRVLMGGLRRCAIIRIGNETVGIVGRSSF